MGCAASKGAAVGSPGYEVASSSSSAAVSGSAAPIWSRPVRLESFDLGREEKEEEEAGEKKNGARRRLRNLHVQGRYVDAEHAAAGWPAWLSSVAPEAVHGWVPLKADRFEKLEKIGQGTYSSVFRAWDLDKGRAVALKKVRFDVSEPDSVRFMAREIIVLRRLHGHPNVVSLHGLIVSRSSPNQLYLVFEYLPHDLAGLLSSQLAPFSQPQIKSYMRQLLAGLEHCHGRGVMHRDIKCANLLVGGDGELKVADFGLANLFSHSPPTPSSPPMTSRVVTLWYRPPELLLGATAYGPSVDLWSAGCVFAELHARRPVLQGRTEVEQIHKIFKLCGSPAGDDAAAAYWASSASAAAAAFRPQTPYESRLRETFGPPAVLPDEPAFALLETLLSVDPARRGTATASLASGYFAASEPSGLLPPQPQRAAAAPSKEQVMAAAAAKALLPGREGSRRAHQQDTTAAIQRHHGRHVHAEESLLPRAPPPEKKQEEAAPPKAAVGPVQLAASTGFAWAKKPRAPPDAAAASYRLSSSKPKTSKASAYEAEKQEMMKQWAQVAEAFCTASSPGEEEDEQTYSNSSRSIGAAAKQLNKSSSSSKSKGMGRADYSGPLLSQPGRVDELLRSHEQQIRRRAAGRRSWFHKGSKREQQPCQ